MPKAKPNTVIAPQAAIKLRQLEPDDEFNSDDALCYFI